MWNHWISYRSSVILCTQVVSCLWSRTNGRLVSQVDLCFIVGVSICGPRKRNVFHWITLQHWWRWRSKQIPLSCIHFLWTLMMFSWFICLTGSGSLSTLATSTKRWRSVFSTLVQLTQHPVLRECLAEDIYNCNESTLRLTNRSMRPLIGASRPVNHWTCVDHLLSITAKPGWSKHGNPYTQSLLKINFLTVV